MKMQDILSRHQSMVVSGSRTSIKMNFSGLCPRHVEINLIMTDVSNSAQDYVCEQAHCEYGGGYMIFNRPENFKEVWRRACDCYGVTIPTESLPDELQRNASADATKQHPSDTLHGHFLPWALIEMPAFTRAFRFVYPTLVAAAEDQAFLWDIPTSRNTITIHDIQMPVDGAILGRINYVELSERFVIICGSQQLRIFSKNPQGALLYHIPASKSSYAKTALDLPDEHEHNNRNLILVPRTTSAHVNDITTNPEPLPPALVDVMRFDDFVAGMLDMLSVKFSKYCSSSYYSARVCPCRIVKFWKSCHCRQSRTCGEW